MPRSSARPTAAPPPDNRKGRRMHPDGPTPHLRRKRQDVSGQSNPLLYPVIECLSARLHEIEDPYDRVEFLDSFLKGMQGAAPRSRSHNGHPTDTDAYREGERLVEDLLGDRSMLTDGAA